MALPSCGVETYLCPSDSVFHAGCLSLSYCQTFTVCHANLQGHAWVFPYCELHKLRCFWFKTMETPTPLRLKLEREFVVHKNEMSGGKATLKQGWTHSSSMSSRVPLFIVPCPALSCGPCLILMPAAMQPQDGCQQQPGTSG